MLLEKENWRLGYHQILSDCLPSAQIQGGTVLILANPDVDALCAARILSYALRADKVPYQLRPCGGFNCLLRILQKLHLNENDGTERAIRAIVLLNLGATRNLEKALFQPTSEVNDEGDKKTSIAHPLLDRNQTKLYVLDSHRPYHLANIYAPKNIVLWNDFNWHDEDGGVPSDGEYLDDESDDSDEDEIESDDDNESDDDDDDVSDAEKEAEFEEENDVSDNEYSTSSTSPVTSGVGSRKKARVDSDTPEIQDSDDREAEQNNQVLSMREQHQARRDKVRRYYRSGAFYSSPVAFMAYTLLADQLRHDSVGDLLWLACIGVTDSFIHDRLDLSGYASLAMDLQEKVEKVYPDLNNDDRITERLANIVHAEELYENGQYNGPLTQVGFSENGRILYQRDEFRFFLLRHTSLWEAMILSPDLNTKMELWKSSGITRLKEMLAKMGLPLAQCQQPYAFMTPSLKRRLKIMMIQHEEEYGLEHLKYTAFVRVSGYKSLLSASDMSLAVTALLECDMNKGSKASEKRNTALSEMKRNDEQMEDESLMNSFNIAYDALNSNSLSSTFGTIGGGEVGGSAEGTDLSTIVNGGDVNGNNGLGVGIRLALSVQKAIIATGISLVERRAITRLSHFRYAYLHATSHGANGTKVFDGGDTDDDGSRNTHHIFSKPLALTRLASYLMEMHRENKKWTGSKALPLVLLAEKPQTKSYLVVGFECPVTKGSSKKNSFRERFELAANSLEDGEFVFDSFDANVIEVKSDVGRFIEQLHYMIDSM
eukprot:CAMPEP_0176488214 /NCGR_PEP_ID=MMETSP0200_2-20121128/6584_1 /TAXON_ID=947934 /ORGANISM="Chaetoceros sp., Strain GSL56" /LENGTH=769 /DNA_ID=CAMNT_0017885171 /DNA_START=106 /DNA_END=2415 /DNA_ORIENTATION=-